jgi:hypothetical protein
LAKLKNSILQIIGAADTRRKRCRRGSRRRHTEQQREVCSLLNSPLQACPPRRCSEQRQRNSSNLKYIRWQVPPQWNPGSLWPYPNENSRKNVSQFGLKCKQSVSGHNVKSSCNGSSADYDRV